MTRRSIILLLPFCLPFLALADPSSAPAPFALSPKKPKASPHAGRTPHPAPSSVAAARVTTPPISVKFGPEVDAWTARTVVDTRFTLELTSTGASRLTTLTARRVMLTREQLARGKKGIERTTTLRSLTATRNGQSELSPAEGALVNRPLGVRLSATGKLTGTIGLVAARDAVADRPEVDPLDENPATGPQLASAAPEDENLKEAWEADAGRYLGLKLSPGTVLYFSERLRLPFLANRELPYFSEQTVVGPVVVNGRPGVELDVNLFSMNISQVTSGVSATTGPNSDFASWARKAHARLSFPEMELRGSARRVIALDGRGLLEQDTVIDTKLTGLFAAEAAGATKPPVKGVALHLERQQRIMSGPPERPDKRGSVNPPSERNGGGRGESRKGPRAREDSDWR